MAIGVLRIAFSKSTSHEKNNVSNALIGCKRNIADYSSDSHRDA